MKTKILSLIISLIVLVLALPQPVLAVYYNRQGDPIATTQQVIAKPQPKTPKNIGIPLRNRRWQTEEYEYITDNQCKTLAVNLYRGETLYSCDDNVMFWSDISIHPTELELMAKNRKKVRDEELNDAIDAAVVSSVTTQMMMR